MRKVIRIGYLVSTIVLMAVQASAVDNQRSLLQGSTKYQTQAPQSGGVYQPVGTATPFQCGKTTCSCGGTSDCFDMGALGVCKDKIVDVKGSPGKGTCTAK